MTNGLVVETNLPEVRDCTRRPKELSCGAMLYTIKKGVIYYVLGWEGGGWLPFKGRPLPDEDLMTCAQREVYEESAYLIRTEIPLLITFATNSKIYHLGLVRVPSNFPEQFHHSRNKKGLPGVAREKLRVKLFTPEEILQGHFPPITQMATRLLSAHLRKEVYRPRKVNIVSKTGEDHRSEDADHDGSDCSSPNSPGGEQVLSRGSQDSLSRTDQRESLSSLCSDCRSGADTV